jgi:hypothetical protein
MYLLKKKKNMQDRYLEWILHMEHMQNLWHRCNAKKLNDLVKQYDSWLNDDMNDDNVNFEFEKLKNNWSNLSEKDEEMFSYLVPLFQLNR